MENKAIFSQSRTIRKTRRFGAFFAALGAVAMAAGIPAAAQSSGAYKVTNLISDGSVPAAVTDPNFLNPWAISTSPTWWISTANTGFNYVVTSAGALNFKVIVPAASGKTTDTGLPAGSVTTAGSLGMVLPSNATKANFIFSTLDGTISGWNSRLGTANARCEIVINNSAAGASYPGLAILNTASASFILAPNFGKTPGMEVYDSNFQKSSLPGGFSDPNLPSNYAPFSVHVINNQIYVAYAQRTTTAPFLSVNGLGNGIVDIFDTTGKLVTRAVTGGALNSPWGIAIAPANFGIYSNALLIGNFGNGMINAYDPKTFTFLGQITDGAGKPLVYENLWELLPGGTTVGGTTAVSGGDTSSVYFTAGLTNEAHGLFGAISKDTSAGTPRFGFSTGSPAVTTTVGGFVQVPIAVSPTFNFTGTVDLSCSGMPANSTCIFSSQQLTVSPTASATATVTLGTIKGASLSPLNPRAVGLVSLALLPFASLLLFRRRNGTAAVRLLGAAMVMVLASTALTGCASGKSTPATVQSTPTGTSNVTLTATSGGFSQSTVIRLTVQ